MATTLRVLATRTGAAWRAPLRYKSDGASLLKASRAAATANVKSSASPDKLDKPLDVPGEPASAPASTPPSPPPKPAYAPPAFDASHPGRFSEFTPRICVIGVGGAGGNAVNNMISRQLQGVEFLVCNTDAQHLSTCLTDNCIQLGKETTHGLGCGANPDAGKAAALESREEIMSFIDGAHMVFITAGMGGGTGTGAGMRCDISPNTRQDLALNAMPVRKKGMVD